MALNLKAKRRAASQPDSDQRSSPDQTGDHSSPTSVQSSQPEEAHQAGARHSQQRRVLGANIEGGAARRHPAAPAGQHATGSFTGEEPENEKKP
jgi:hypothetical protein